MDQDPRPTDPARTPAPAHRSVLIDQACERLGVSKRSIYYWIRQGRLQTVRTLGGSQRILLASLLELAESRARRAKRRSLARARAAQSSSYPIVSCPTARLWRDPCSADS